MKTQILIGLLAGLLVSCHKEGCTDSDAVNYDYRAETDDASCRYEARLTFWYSPETAAALQDSGVTEISIYVDNQHIGSSSTVTGGQNQPLCDEPGAATIVKPLGCNKYIVYGWVVKDQNGVNILAHTWNATAAACQTLEINL